MRTWGEAAFRQLSPMVCSGQTLWLYLLTCEVGLAIPGLIPHGLATIAERRGWNASETAEAWTEIEQLGLGSLEPSAPLIWLPSALAINKPDNPNQVLSWGKSLELVPECALRARAISEIEEYLAQRGETFVAEFRKGCNA